MRFHRSFWMGVGLGALLLALVMILFRQHREGISSEGGAVAARPHVGPETGAVAAVTPADGGQAASGTLAESEELARIRRHLAESATVQGAFERDVAGAVSSARVARRSEGLSNPEPRRSVFGRVSTLTSSAVSLELSADTADRPAMEFVVTPETTIPPGIQVGDTVTIDFVYRDGIRKVTRIRQ